MIQGIFFPSELVAHDNSYCRGNLWTLLLLFNQHGGECFSLNKDCATNVTYPSTNARLTKQTKLEMIFEKKIIKKKIEKVQETKMAHEGRNDQEVEVLLAKNLRTGRGIDCWWREWQNNVRYQTDWFVGRMDINESLASYSPKLYRGYNCKSWVACLDWQKKKKNITRQEDQDLSFYCRELEMTTIDRDDMNDNTYTDTKRQENAHIRVRVKRVVIGVARNDSLRMNILFLCQMWK